MFRSTTVVFALSFLLVALVDGYNKNINYSHYRNCSHEYRHIGRRDGRQYPDFTNFLKLSSFKYGICEDEIHLRFYFKGDADFHVLFTKHRRLPEPNEKMFNVCKHTLNIFSKLILIQSPFLIRARLLL